MPCPCPICQKKGACCYDGTCTEESCADCETLGGLWQGFGTECDGSDCPCSTPADHASCEQCADAAVTASCPTGQECCDGRCCAEGDYCCSYGCCHCRVPWGWQIIDQDYNLYAAGSIVNGQFQNLPNPFTPLWYWESGTTIDFELRIAGCDTVDRSSYEVISQWQLTVTLCGTTADRYPEESPVGGTAPSWTGTLPPPSGCADKLRRCTNDCPEEGCEACPDLSVGSTGNGIVGVAGGTAHKFVGTIDGEWTNLNNWEDANGVRPAGALPGALDSVVINADVTSKPTDYVISVYALTINANKNFAVEAECVSLLCRGTVSRPVAPVCSGTFGRVLYSAAASFVDGVLDGEVVQGLSASAASFTAGSLVSSPGVVTGNATFDVSDNEGVVTGDAEFANGSRNKTGATVQGNAVFRTGSLNTQATVVGDAEFYNDSANTNATVQGNAAFYGASTNESNANVNGTATFNDSSSNTGTANVYGAATFNGSSYNAAHCWSTAVFNGSTENQFLVSGNATFNGASRNKQGALVGGNATFNSTSRNAGSISGTATFNGSSCNEATGTAAAFVPNPPPSC